MIRLSRKQRFVRGAITSFGFLSGVWIHLGFDPQSRVHDLLAHLLTSANPEYGHAIALVFFALPIITACAALLGTYRHAGWIGLLSLALAFYAGLRFDVFGAGLLAAALLIGLLATRR